MVRAAAFTAALADVWAAITAIQLCYSMSLQPSAGASTTTTAWTSAQASASAGDLDIFLALVAAGGLNAAVALVYSHLHQAEAAAAAPGGGNRRMSDLVTFILLAAAGTLDYALFVDDGDVGAQARALGLVAARVLPAASIGAFFLGMVLMILAHVVRAGGEEGGGGDVAGDGQIQAPVWLPLFTKMAFAAAGGLVCLMAMALYTKY